eukprot:scaffold31954_cov66-Phaeocystis_antarctica.AAC.7
MQHEQSPGGRAEQAAGSRTTSRERVISRAPNERGWNAYCRYFVKCVCGIEWVVGPVPVARRLECTGLNEYRKIDLLAGSCHSLARAKHREQRAAAVGQERLVRVCAHKIPHVACCNARAAGCGVESTMRERSRSAWLAARCHATAPPQSWPTKWKRVAPRASAIRSTSSQRSGIL